MQLGAIVIARSESDEAIQRHFRLDCFAPLRAARNDDIESRSRDAAAHPNYENAHATLGLVIHRTLIRWSMLSLSRQTLGGKRCASEASVWIAGPSPAEGSLREAESKSASARRRVKPGHDGRKNGKNERKNIGGETPTDARLLLPCLTDTALPGNRQAHIYRRSTAVLAPRSFSSQGTQPRAMLPGTWRTTFCAVL
jgi:hypothetical protein